MPWIRIESIAYWSLFVTSFLAMAVWESVQPWRNLGSPAERRWSKHGIVLVVCTLLSVGIYRISPVVMAATVAGSRFGLLNKTWLPLAARWILAILLLDLVRYLVHRVHHAIALLWRLHQVHHSDPEFDVSTGVRVHPIESILNQGAYLTAVAILAPPLSAVLMAELGSVFQSFFSHANVSLPRWADRPLRMVFVTPNMHRIHHSEEISDQNRNLGDIFPWWDQMFGTYLDVPAAGEEGMVTGLKGCQDEGSLALSFMLAQPFRAERSPMVDEPASPV